MPILFELPSLFISQEPRMVNLYNGKLNIFRNTNTENSSQDLNSSIGSNSSFGYGRWNASGYSEPHKNHWSQALYATMKDPSMVEFEDDEICIVKGIISF